MPQPFHSVVVAAGLAALACSGGRPAAPPATVVVEVAGCALVRRGPVCEVTAETVLQLWVAGPAWDESTLDSDRGPVRAGGTAAVEGGTAYREVRAPERAAWLRWRGRRGATRAEWRLALEAGRDAPALKRAARLREQGKHAEAAQLLEGALPALAPDQAARAEALLGRIEAQADPARGLARSRRAMERQLAAGRLSDAIDEANYLAFKHIRAGDLGAARAVVDSARPQAGDYPEGRINLGRHEAMLEEASGDLRGALRRYRALALEARRVSLADLERYLRQDTAGVLVAIGRIAEAFALQRQIVAESAADTPCNRAAAASDLAWFATLGAARPPPAARELPPPAPLLAEARRQLEACREDWRSRIGLINEALHAGEIGDPAALRSALAALDRLTDQPGPTEQVWQLGARAQLAALDGQPRRALELALEQERLARSIGFTEGALRGLATGARALERLGRRDRAIAALESAEALVDEALRSVPLGEGRDVYARARDDTARRLVGTLIEAKRPDRAADAARRARARLLRALARPARLDQLAPAERRRWETAVGRYLRVRTDLEDEARGDWRLTADEVTAARTARTRRASEARALLDDAYRILDRTAAPAPAALARPGAGQLFVVVFPTAVDWRAFAVGAGWTRVGPGVPFTAAQTADERAARLLAPFAAELRRAATVRLFPYGELETVDWAALPLDGAPLGAQRPVEYGLDLAGGRPATRPAPGAAALVVANPTLDLPGAAREGKAVVASVGGGAVVALDGQRATRAGVLAALPGARLFHYAGHATYGGHDGAESALRLANDERILLGDVLSLPAAPPLVVLSACDASGAAGVRTAAGFGLAQAFLAVGTATVVAPARPLGDEGAPALMEAFYRELIGPGALTSSEALARARRTAPDLVKGLPEYRVLVP